MGWGKRQIDLQAVRTASEDYAAFEMIGLSEIEGARVLDVGCFDGLNTVLKFAPYSNIERAVGIDPESDAVLEATSQADDSRFEFLCSSFEEYECSEPFDLVYFSHVMQHLKDPALACEKAFRLLRPGGWVVVKTVDDALKVSYPDPDNVMRRLFALYEQYVLPNTDHTKHTDRYFGQKCPSLMLEAGFTDVEVRTFAVDTLGKTPEERKALFDRCVYFRRNVPSCVDSVIADRVTGLVQRWRRLFEREDYYFMTQSLIVVARKPGLSDGRSCLRQVDGGIEKLCGDLVVRPMEESDLGGVMSIEVAAFPSPWTPVAYAMDLRHNPASRYEVALDQRGELVGYVGWWLLGDRATIMRVAVAERARGCGLGSKLVARMCEQAKSQGAGLMHLEVRGANDAARAMYRGLGFVEAELVPGYYSDPVDDAVIMIKTLG